MPDIDDPSMPDIDDPRIRKACKIISVISCALLAMTALYALNILIKYKDYQFLYSTTEEQRYMWQYFGHETNAMWLDYWSEYNVAGILFGIAIVLFVVSGLPKWKDYISNPASMLSAWEKKLLRRILKKLKIEI